MQRDADPVKGAGKAEQPVETELKRVLKSRAWPGKEAGFIWGALSKCEPTEPFVAGWTRCASSHVVSSYNLGSGPANIAVNGTFTDGKWHRVKAVRWAPAFFVKKILWKNKNPLWWSQLTCGCVLLSLDFRTTHTHTTVKSTSQVSVTTCQM